MQSRVIPTEAYYLAAVRLEICDLVLHEDGDTAYLGNVFLVRVCATSRERARTPLSRGALERFRLAISENLDDTENLSGVVLALESALATTLNESEVGYSLQLGQTALVLPRFLPPLVEIWHHPERDLGRIVATGVLALASGERFIYTHLCPWGTDASWEVRALVRHFEQVINDSSVPCIVTTKEPISGSTGCLIIYHVNHREPTTPSAPYFTFCTTTNPTTRVDPVAQTQDTSPFVPVPLFSQLAK